VRPPGRDEAFVVEMGVDAGELDGQAGGWSGRSASQVASGGVVTRSTVISYTATTVSFDHNQPRTPLAFPQLSGYFDPE
jgi:hypothetical protein